MKIKPSHQNNQSQCEAVQSVNFSFTPIPVLLIRKMREFGLTPSEFALLTHFLAAGSRGDGDTVSASLRRAEKETGLAHGTVYRAKDGLLAKGILKITNERNKARTNTYDLTPLKEKLSREVDGKNKLQS